MTFEENEYACSLAKSHIQFFCQKSFKTFTLHFSRTIMFVALVVSMLCAASFKSNASWWTEAYNAHDPSGSHFKANFNPTNGTIHIESYVYNGAYFLVALGPLTYSMWVQSATMSYSLDGINYVDFYRFGFDHGTQNINTQLGGFSTSTFTSSSAYGDRLLNMNLQLINSIKNIKNIRIKARLVKDGPGGPDDIEDTKTVNVTQMSSISTPTYDFVTTQNGNVYTPQAKISYTKIQLNEIDNLSNIKLYNSSNVAQSGNLAIATSGFFNVATSSSAISYYYRQVAYNERWFNNSSQVTVPAFTFPKTASAAYNVTTHAVTFSWTIDPVTGNNLVTDNFKIQVADNPNFTDARSVSIDYDPTKSSFSYTTDKNLYPHMYFRVARDYVGFNWDLAVKADVAISIVTLDPTKVSLTLLNDNTAQIKWDPIQGAWIPNGSFVITRVNNTSNTQTAITLTKADYDKGVYIDKQISICNEYTYTLQLLPPIGSSFTALAAIPINSTVLPTQIGTIQNLVASKGYFPDRTELRWSSQGAFDNFIIKRAVYGTNNFVQVGSIAGASNSDFQTDDSKGTPGVYYTYSIVGVIKCNNKLVYSLDTLYAIGFRSPTGNIYGRVTYENGQAVENVAVRLQSNDEAQTGKSILLNGTNQSFLKLDSLITPFTDSSLTVEAWIKPTDASPINQVIFSRANQYELGFNASGQLYFKYRNNSATGTYTNTSQTYVHVAGVHTKDSLFILLNGQVIGKVADAYQASTSPAKIVYIGRNTAGNYYKGYIDEMRVWNIAVPISRLQRDYTRLLAGDEKGLVAYWRFDETISNQFYDVSHRSDQYNQNDGNMVASGVTRSANVPTADQLSLKAYTDLSGNYFISGIPFSGNGTTYTIVPLLGTHQFDPASVNRLMSASSTEFTVDFKDKSSFPVSGFVYYKGGTIPVSGVQFKIDGQYAQQGNGSIIETDDNGKFTISVPVGTHEVMALKPNHVFVNNGKITDIFGNNLNYQGVVNNRILTDSTTIRFIGRVSGGSLQEGYPLGHSLSLNNLGKSMSVTMLLPSGNKYEIYTPIGGSTQKTVTNLHLLPSNKSDSGKIHKSRVEYQKNKIIIYPDSITGEFIADIIPEKFIANTVDVTGWGDILDGKPVLIDFSSKFPVLTSINSYKDSSRNGQGVYVTKNYLDTVQFNASYKFIKRRAPEVEIKQLDGNRKPLPYFGNITYESLSFTGKKDTIIVVDTSKIGKAAYKYGNPVFVQNQVFNFNIRAFEQYPFYETVLNDGTKIVKQQNGKDVVDNVATSDGFVSILNRIRNGSANPDTLSLDSKGMANYQFTAGDPNLVTKGLKDLTATVRFGQATNINWNWLGNAQLKVYVMGGKLTGTDFVTAGPDKMLMVLRDPPGAKSFSYAESGSTITNSTTYSGSLDQEGDLDLTQKLGAELVTFTGIGVGVINSAVASTGFTVGVHHEEHYTYTNTKETSTTLTTRFQTSDDPLFVGPVADVFVGYSTNITYGQSNNITMIKRADLKASDIFLYEPDPASEFIVIQRGGINIGETFATLFAYPQQHIEKILIPNLINIRNTALLPSTVVPADAQSLANSLKKPVYVSKLAIGDANFGKSNSDTIAFGATAKSDPFGDGKSYKIYFPATSLYRTDTVMILNQYVATWKKRMADNEKAKLESVLMQNYSFHAASPIAFSTATSIKNNTENAFNFVVSGSVTNSTDVKIQGNGFEFKFKESIGTNQGGVVGSSTETTSTLGFNMASEGTDDYFSIDVNRAADNSLVFRTKGGVSGCPYAGATLTTYYQPGTLIDQPTQRAEVPKLSVDKPVVNDVPSSRKASYILTLRNESEARLPATFVLSYTDNDSIKGATIAVDGVSIGGKGRAVVVQFGDQIQKVLTLTKGPTAMDYNNIMILLHSGCQYDPTGYRENIADTVLISAHFIPSCSDINIKSPKDKWVLNTESPVNVQGKRYLPLAVDQFDVNNSLFDRIELQYKPTSSSTWINAMSFYADSTKFKAAQGEKQFITNAQAINYNLELDDAAFNDQNYDIQAVSYCKVGSNSFVTTESNMISGIKDTYYPRLFGTPQPANGILGISDEVRLNFNETIAAGLLTYTDFQVTGIRNGVKGDHTVSVRLDGIKNYLYTEFDKNLTGKNLTAETWILPDKQATQTVISHGSVNEAIELAVTSDNYLQVTVGSQVIKSSQAFAYKAGEWAHVALKYNAASKTISAYYNFVELIHNAPVSIYTGIGHFEFGRSIRQQGNYFAGNMHELRVWSDTLSSIQIQINSLTQLSGGENGLLAYYPMNEGKGVICFDKAHGSNAKLNGQWNTPAGKSVSLNGNGYVKVNTSFAPVTSKMDYTIELWFKAQTGQTDATLLSNGRGDGTDANGSLNLINLGFEQGMLTFNNNGFKIKADGNYIDNNWHHVALAVNRNSGNAQLFVDGLLNKYFDAKNLGGVARANTYVGARVFNHPDSSTVNIFDRYFKGNIDEVRIWNTYLNQTLVAKNNNVRLKGNEIGLLAYYPFEKYTVFQNNAQLIYSLSDAKIQTVPNTVVPDGVATNATETSEKAPIKDSGPVDNLKFDYVVNNDGLIITMQEPRQAIDKTIITFKVKNVRDLNGNPILSPITWTAYIDQNQLKWSDDAITLSKDVYAPLQFSSNLVNSGGSSQHYTLGNLPQWLTADPATGTIGPKGQQKVTFTVNQGLNVGAYEELIFMRNDNNESEALKLNLTVKGKQPNWTVNPADFKYNMSVYGKIRVNNVFSINKEDILAAFINGKCVGVTRNTYLAVNDFWYAFLTVYSDDIVFNNLEFRIWQASTGKTFQASTSIPVTFTNNAIAGSPTNPVIFDGKEMLLQDITLQQNWNWISLNLLNPAFNNIGGTLANGSWTGGDLVKNELLGFSQYSSASGWVGYLSAFNNVNLFMLKTAKAQTLSITGTAVDVKTTPIPLKGARWNYISYLPQVNITVKEALSGYAANDEDVIKSQTGFSMFSTQNGWIGNLTFLEPGKGYMLYRKAASDVSFNYPSLNGSLTNTIPRGVNPNQFQSPVEGNFSYASNMTVLAVIGSDFDFKRGDSVLAFVGGELRGKSKPVINPDINQASFFFNIAGETDQPVYFMIERAGELIARSTVQLPYQADAKMGTLKKPIELHFTKEVSGITVYPNPFKNSLTLNVAINSDSRAASHKVQVSVYDILGRVLLQKPAETVINNNYRMSWNGRTSSGQECSKGTYFIHVIVDGVPRIYKVIKH